MTLTRKKLEEWFRISENSRGDALEIAWLRLRFDFAAARREAKRKQSNRLAREGKIRKGDPSLQKE